MSIEFSTTVSQSQRYAMQASLNKIFSSKNVQNILSTQLLDGLRSHRSIEKFVNFVTRSDFAGYFGVPPGDFSLMKELIQKTFTYESLGLHSVTDIGWLSISFKIVSEDYLRKITYNEWDNTRGMHTLAVNAWDILEYGIIGGAQDGGVIKDYKVKPAISWIEKDRISRSHLALMRKSRGASFSFSGIGGAPQINEIRSTLIGSQETLGRRLIPKIKEVLRQSF
jgi:hypothetical protein